MTYRQNGAGLDPKLTSTTSAVHSETTSLLPVANPGAREPRPLSSVLKTFGNIVISIVGAGVLGLPFTFQQAGWLSGSVALGSMGFACYHNMMLLVRSKRKLENEGSDGIGSYSDLGFAVFGHAGEIAVDFMVFLSQGGFCVGYLIFIGENLASVFFGADQSGSGGMSLGQRALSFGGESSLGINWEAKAVYVWIIFPFQVWLASVRSLTTLAPFSMFADVANFAAMVVVMSADIIHVHRDGFQNIHAFTEWSALPFVMGVSIYAFEAFGLILPIESNMKNRSDFASTLASAMTFVTVLFICFACLGSFAFGDLTKDIITLNLGAGWQTTVIKLSLCFGLFFTFPVMMHPVHEVVERRFMGGRPSMVLRSLVVLTVAWTAVSVPHFGEFLSLLGSSICSLMSFVVPALFHLRTHHGELRWDESVVDIVFIAFGVIFGIWGTWTTLQQW